MSTTNSPRPRIRLTTSAPMSVDGASGAPPPGGISSLLDTDLYKLTMQCAVRKHFANTPVSYKFTNRTPHMKFTRPAFDWMRGQIDQFTALHVRPDELVWLQKECPYLTAEYIDFLRTFRMRPQEHIQASFTPIDAQGGNEELGDINLTIHGLWEDTILYEIPLLALISETYFKFMDRNWSYDGQKEKAKEKGLELLEAGCVFSEFGSRRRRDYHTHQLVMQGLLEASKEGASRGLPGKFTGSSNVHMAMQFGVTPIGTVAHEWFMGIAAIKDDYARANELALKYWVETFGHGVLGIALTDTFGTPTFLRAFSQPAPPDCKSDSSAKDGKDPTYAEIFTGVRQDSGDPLAFIGNIRRFYDSQGIHSKKVVVFSDSLNVERCIKYKAATEADNLTPSFGIGTFFTNDYRNLKTGEKSVPLNIVIKLSHANGQPAVKLSDDVGKNMGEDSLVQRIKKEVGYTDRSWAGGNEAHRWDA